MNGTSMATPMTAGVAALLLSYDRAMTVATLRARLLAGVQAISALAGRVATGRLNATGALRAAGASVPDAADANPTIAPAIPALPQQRARPDSAAPTVKLRVLSRRRASVLRRGLVASVHCSETCNARLHLSLARRSGRVQAGTDTPASVRAARVVATRGHAATAHLNARTRAAIRSGRRVTLALHASVADLAGNTRRTTRTVTLRR